MAPFAHVDSWIFDLDNTLYPARANLFGQIDIKMGDYIGARLAVAPDEARRIQKRFFHEHGTTLRGLMDDHGVEPNEFLDFVHDIDLGPLAPDAQLRAGLARLPGRRLVFTNADSAYALRVLEKLEIADLFEAVCCIHATRYRPKPDPRAYQTLLERHGIAPARALFVEDMARNLAPAKALGMATVWVDNGSEHGAHGADGADFIDLRIEDVSQWLGAGV